MFAEHLIDSTRPEGLTDPLEDARDRELVRYGGGYGYQICMLRQESDDARVYAGIGHGSQFNRDILYRLYRWPIEPRAFEIETMRGVVYNTSESLETIADIGVRDGQLYSIATLRLGATLEQLGRLLHQRGEHLDWQLARALFALFRVPLGTLHGLGFPHARVCAGELWLRFDNYGSQVWLTRTLPLEVRDGAMRRIPWSAERVEQNVADLARTCAALSDGPGDDNVRELLADDSACALDVLADRILEGRCEVDELVLAHLMGGSPVARQLARRPTPPPRFDESDAAKARDMWQLAGKAAHLFLPEQSGKP